MFLQFLSYRIQTNTQHMQMVLHVAGSCSTRMYSVRLQTDMRTEVRIVHDHHARTDRLTEAKSSKARAMPNLSLFLFSGSCGFLSVDIYSSWSSMLTQNSLGAGQTCRSAYTIIVFFQRFYHKNNRMWWSLNQSTAASLKPQM